MTYYNPKPTQVSNDAQLMCSSCKVTVLPNERNSHYRSDWHRYNVKRKCVNMEPIEKSIFEEKLKSIIDAGQKLQSKSKRKRGVADNQQIQRNYDTLISNEQWESYKTTSNVISRPLLHYKCTLCRKTFKSHQSCLTHLKCSKHKAAFIQYHRNLRAQQQAEIDIHKATNGDAAAEPDPDNNNNNNAVDMEQLVPLKKLVPMTSIENNPFIIVKPSKQRNHRNDDESKEGPKDDNQSENATPPQPRVSIDVNKQCLFCSKSMESQELCLEHMMTEHGFFVPLSKRLTDLDKLFKIAGDLIGKSYKCVWCWQRTKSVSSCQEHMRAMGHCKFRLEYGTKNGLKDSPFIDLYDFDKKIVNTDDEDDVEGVVVKSDTKVVEANAIQELVRSDGTVIGHRDNQIMYRQKHHHLMKFQKTQNEQQIISQINYPQKKFKLEAIQRERNVEAFKDSGAIEQSKGNAMEQHKAMNLQTRQHVVNYQNWVALQKSRGLYI